MSNIDLSRESLEAIKADAARATDGPWEFEHDPDGQTIRVNAGSARTRWVTDEHGDRWPEAPSSYYSTDRIIDLDEMDYEADEFDHAELNDEFAEPTDEQRLLANAQHIANADPDFVTALIDRCLALEAALNRVTDLSMSIDRSPLQPQEWIDPETGTTRDVPESIRQALGDY